VSGKALIVTWHDAHAYKDRWMEVGAIDGEPCVVRSTGWLMEDAKAGHIVLAQSTNSDGELDGLLCIPVAMVASIKVLFDRAEPS
jgi:hypothetical protein